MCGRFELKTEFDKLPKVLKKDYPIGLDSKYETQKLIRPTDPVLVIKNEGKMKTTFMSWGFISPWTKDPFDKKRPRPFNARSETVEEKKLFSPMLVEYSDANNTDYKENRPVYLSISLLNEFDRPKLVKKFIWDLADRNNLSTSVNSVKTANDIGRHDFAVQAGKILYYNHTILDPLSFPQIERPEFGKIIFPEQSLIHSVTRQESQFDPKAGSYAGAKGLMQLMPYTAKRVSKGLKLEYTKSKLTEDPKYNVILGSAYLDKLLSNYNGSYILSLAAYNAGESRVSRWIKKYGDPRKDDITSENWIELIPFKETRNYVQRVMENIQVYEFIENGLKPIEYTLSNNLNRAYVGGKTLIKPSKKKES